MMEILRATGAGAGEIKHNLNLENYYQSNPQQKVEESLRNFDRLERVLPDAPKPKQLSIKESIDLQEKILSGS